MTSRDQTGLLPRTGGADMASAKPWKARAMVLAFGAI